ncbi:hypothetical protein [Metabacillus mangrovi]|uniref:hypothetical protein n=1 Tax=Metabacillus mangrovi TaxID=1491830 RepID=UPI001F4FF968|nr:hypothetical protein [Metabacillus mangrovi]
MEWMTAADRPLRYTEDDAGVTELLPSYRIDMRHDGHRDRFFHAGLVSDWSQLTWKEARKPYEVRTVAKSKRTYEKENGEMSVKTSWEYFNRSFHEWFVKDVPGELTKSRQELKSHLARFRLADVKEALGETVRLSLWNYAHRIEDGVWGPV